MTAARLDLMVLDTPDPRRLAAFYSELLSWPLTRAEDDWCEVRGPSGPGLGFQLAPDLRPPTWPEPTVPQQAHLDVDVDDMDEAQARALRLGATATGHPLPGTTAAASDSFRVFRDPAGHPFCLCRATPDHAPADVADNQPVA